MGYQISALASMSGDLSHGLFATYVPAHGRVRHMWINDWIYAHFDAIASTLGPESVIVAPSDRRSFADYDLDHRNVVRGTTGFLNAGFPVLIISNAPYSQESQPRVRNAVAINLAAFSTEDLLAHLFDQISQFGRSRGDISRLEVTIPETDLRSEYNTERGGWDYDFEKALELKPNVFGLGVNLNEIAGLFRSRRARNQNRQNLQF